MLTEVLLILLGIVLIIAGGAVAVALIRQNAHDHRKLTNGDHDDVL